MLRFQGKGEPKGTWEEPCGGLWGREMGVCEEEWGWIGGQGSVFMFGGGVVSPQASCGGLLEKGFLVSDSREEVSQFPVAP